jgi:hypothetical protein
MNSELHSIFLHGRGRFNACTAVKGENLSRASGCFLEFSSCDLSHIRSEDINSHLMFFFQTFDDRFDLFVDGFLDASVGEFQDHVEVVFALSDVYQELIDIFLVVSKFFIEFFDQLLFKRSAIRKFSCLIEFFHDFFLLFVEFA